MPRPALPPRSDLYLCAHAPWKHHDRVVTEWVAPVVRAVADTPEADSFFFVRMNVPTWQVRLRLVGDRAWLDGPYRRLAEQHAAPLLDHGVVELLEATHYQRETERYGGDRGMALAEALYSADTRACLEWIALEGDGEDRRAVRNRRELALLTGELYTDLLGLAGYDRGDFYHCGYRWALQMDSWGARELGRLEERYRQLEPGLARLLDEDTETFAAERWGGEEAAAVARRLAEEITPVLTEVRRLRERGELPHLPYLAWSYTHLLCNRLGLPPAAEAIVRYLGHRFHSGHRGVPEPASYPLPPVPEDTAATPAATHAATEDATEAGSNG